MVELELDVVDETGSDDEDEVEVLELDVVVVDFEVLVLVVTLLVVELLWDVVVEVVVLALELLDVLVVFTSGLIDEVEEVLEVEVVVGFLDDEVLLLELVVE